MKPLCQWEITLVTLQVSQPLTIQLDLQIALELEVSYYWGDTYY
jgi:hypothetical protein